MGYGHPLGWVGGLEIYPMSFRKQSFVVWQESQQVLHVETMIIWSDCSKVILDYPLMLCFIWKSFKCSLLLHLCVDSLFV